MRKITASFFMSLDGVVDSPQEWHFPYMDQEAQVATQAGTQAADTILLGRATYQEWAAFWPGQGMSSPFAEFVNTTPKLIVSRTLDTLEWAGSTQIADAVPATLRQEKQKQGEDIAVFGSGTLVSALLLEGLVDELRLMVHPIVVGSGKRLFEAGGQARPLELVETKTFKTGVLSLTYAPASPGA